jgi:NAD-dependent dihydropyrimidine dehydrogenase PreA subunit
MSETVLFYFSGTGNSLAVTRNIAGHFTDAAIVPLLKTDAAAYIEADTERIGFIYPIYMNAVPRVVVKFIKELKCLPGKYIFAVATHGGLPGKAGLHIDKVLKDRQLVLDAYFEVEMLNNTPKGVAPKPLMKLNWELDITPGIVGDKLKAAEAAIGGIAQSVLDKEKNMCEYQSAKGKGISYWLIKQMWKMNEKSKPKLDFVLDECCTDCGLCETLCTTNRIKLKEGKPEWTTNDCNYCYACFNYCPTQAIGVKHYTKKLGRYHHPDIGAVDISGQKER